MPIHDWTRVAAGTWHDFHLGWVSGLQRSLNCELLPDSHYAQAEHAIGSDVPILHEADAEAESNAYLDRRRRIAIRHNSGDRIVALIELVSPGNKASAQAMQAFLDKAYESIERGYHLLVIDLFPPGPRDPQGIHAAIWSELGEVPEPMPPDEPLTLVAYAAGMTRKAYIEPAAVSCELIDMPLFLTADYYVNVPLEKTYGAAFQGMPRKWKAVLKA